MTTKKATTEVSEDSPEALLARRMAMLSHPDGGLIRLVQFSHDSPGLRIYRIRVAQAILNTLAEEGWTLKKSTTSKKSINE